MCKSAKNSLYEYDYPQTLLNVLNPQILREIAKIKKMEDITVSSVLKVMNLVYSGESPQMTFQDKDITEVINITIPPSIIKIIIKDKQNNEIENSLIEFYSLSVDSAKNMIEECVRLIWCVFDNQNIKESKRLSEKHIKLSEWKKLKHIKKILQNKKNDTCIKKITEIMRYLYPSVSINLKSSSSQEKTQSAELTMLYTLS